MDTQISSVRVVELTGTLPASRARGGSPPHAGAISVYPKYHRQEVRPGEPVAEPKKSIYVEIGTTAKIIGRYGPVDQEAVPPFSEGLAISLLGLDPLSHNFIWDLLQRANRHSRHGYRKMAISAIDNAVWDLRGRLLGVPVWQLLGGSGRPHIPAYASTLGSFHGEGEVEEVAEALLDQGFTAQKWFFGDGPSQGAEGMDRNVSLVERTRATVGDRSELMFDAFMSWNPTYARRWARRVSGLRPDWLEEPFPAGAVESFAQLRASTDIPLAAGEHLYDRHDVLPFLQRDLLSVLQVDPEWCGGVTELVKMAALAETYGVQVMPHGHGIHAALHVVASQSPEVSPRVEYLYNAMPERHYFEVGTPAPHRGAFSLPERPGFGIEFDESRVEQRDDLITVS